MNVHYLQPNVESETKTLFSRYHDAMAIVRVHGKPTFFVTFTCNPKWREITDALLEGQRPEDRPDILSRVFQLKLRQLLRELTKDGIFGRCVAMLMVVEFQKRGKQNVCI